MSSGHALFSPSAAHRWIACPGSFAYPANTADDESSSVYADDGTASHHWGAGALLLKVDADFFLGEKTVINGREYVMDEARAEFVQIYLNHVRQLALGKTLFVEHWIDLSEYLGEGQGGTCDVGIIEPEMITAVDLKYGMGEKVFTSYIGSDSVVRPNHQLGLYCLGLLKDARLLGHDPKRARLVIVQPRLGHIDEYECDIAELETLGCLAKVASMTASKALVHTPEQALQAGWMSPGEKTCRWCRAQAECPALAAYAQAEVREDFDVIVATENVPEPHTDTKSLSRHMLAVPLIEQWCKAVRAAVTTAVGQGQEIIGPDCKPMKFVEGKSSGRAWSDVSMAEGLLVQQIGEKAYSPREVITAPAAAKLLDKKATKQLWADVFVPLIKRAPGKPTLALGSDPRPPYTAAADATDFEDET